MPPRVLSTNFVLQGTGDRPEIKLIDHPKGPFVEAENKVKQPGAELCQAQAQLSSLSWLG